MSAKEADINTIIGKVITRSHAIEKLLRTTYRVNGRGLHKAIDDLSDTLPAVLARTIRIIAIARNAAAHPEGFEADDVPLDFDRLCSEIELLIPYFANQLNSKRIESPKQPTPPVTKSQKTPSTAHPEQRTNGIEPKLPAKEAQPPWSPTELQQLTDGFDSQTTIPELAKALNRGIGGVQRKLIKLGKLAKDEYKAYPPDANNRIA
jgi:hypothetical protein